MGLLWTQSREDDKRTQYGYLGSGVEQKKKTLAERTKKRMDDFLDRNKKNDFVRKSNKMSANK